MEELDKATIDSGKYWLKEEYKEDSAFKQLGKERVTEVTGGEGTHS